MTPTTFPTPTASAVGVVDPAAWLALPPGLANATVVIDQFGDNELRIRKVEVGPVEPDADIPDPIEPLQPLSDRDRDLFLDLLDNPLDPAEALEAAVADYKRRYG